MDVYRESWQYTAAAEDAIENAEFWMNDSADNAALDAAGE